VEKYSHQVEIFGRNLRRLRKEKGLSQQALADECEIDRVTLTRIENGKYGAGLHIIYALAAALKIKAKELFEE